MRAYGQWRVLALAGLLTVAACTSSSEGLPTPVAAATSAPATPTPAPTEPPVTPTEAAAVFAEYIASDDLLRAALRADQNLTATLKDALDLTSGAQAQLVIAAYQLTGYKPPRHTWGPPRLVVPKLDPGSAMPWFTVLTKRDGREAILTFAKSPDWRLSSLTLLEPDTVLPEVKIDADGYAEALPLDDKSVLISPRFVSSLHASVAESGPKGITGELIAPGLYTTKIAEQIEAAREKARRMGQGFGYDSIFTAGDYPIYALRTTDGGALVQYSLTRTSTTTNDVDPKGPGVPIPEAIQRLLPPERAGEPKQTAQHQLKVFETQQYTASIPPASSATGQAAVLAHDSAITRASAD
ncbi:hypothetical protein ACIBG8_22615 [Nonomuraea sp. NPDC050556]|uniref:hypothetical protein n=1 Tax=Nonomuraea sp. NPDC050556 TaxID=3364369 RepID=UPI00379C8426